mmetsp:Transcript_11248/g.24357  ORF Transcript_11248/g.24357 Transcript_11248/m.24357 type:complete len:583 (+) Transcript_11248:118-1866(+)
MWARRLGVPHLWPSRVKVFFLGGMTSVVIFSVFQYLHGANVEYLDLAKPVSNEIQCRLPRADCLDDEDPVTCTILLEDRKIWRGLNLTDPCPIIPKAIATQSCRNPYIPLDAVTGDLGSLRTVKGVNPFKLWSILFLILTSILSFSIVIHDLALLEESLRPSILSIPNMKYAVPCLWEVLTCVQCRRRMQRLQRKNRCLWGFLIPMLTMLHTMAFMVVLYPVAFTVYMLAPVRMSRIMVFLSAILCVLWSIIFVIETAMDTQPYAVLWGLDDDSPEEGSCVCLCEFYLSRSVILRVVVLATGVCWNSFNLSLRALKGLRRAQWANMFSVLYSVPVEAFPVTWQRPPDSGPIRHRSEGEAIQSEPAFDPFCLMDEQPESAWTRAVISCEVQTEQQQFLWEPFAGVLDTEIGCCGFPRPVVLDPISRDTLNEDEELSYDEGGNTRKALKSHQSPEFSTLGGGDPESSPELSTWQPFDPSRPFPDTIGAASCGESPSFHMAEASGALAGGSASSPSATALRTGASTGPRENIQFAAPSVEMQNFAQFDPALEEGSLLANQHQAEASGLPVHEFDQDESNHELNTG